MHVDIDRGVRAVGKPAFVIGKLPWWAIATICVISLVIPVLGFLVIPFFIYDYFRYTKSQQKLHYVSIEIDFTQEELQIIKENDLGKQTFLERPRDATQQSKSHWQVDDHIYWLTIRKLVDGKDTFYCKTPAEARSYENDLTDTLPKLKEFLEANVVDEEELGVKSFEF